MIEPANQNPRPRGRPRLAPDAQASRKALLRAGLAQLTERGYVAVRLDDIVAAAGVTKGAFYHHFRSKADYGAALIAEYDAFFRARIARSLGRADLAPLARLQDFAKMAETGMARFDFRRGCLVGNLGQEMASLPKEYRAMLIAVLEGWQDMTATCLRAAQDAGEIASDQDPETLAALFWTGWEGAVLRAKLERNPAPLRQFSAGFLRLVSK
ncbi:TetR/AcrR family transcriptional regulator [Thioclava sp.]|uniref:acrylate utilization transcriptional regulator AcuR n=1 Tax=Thioclava sp. TaxID=1933450 RepID=UPI003AA86198